MPSTIFLMTQSDDTINYTFLHFTLCPLGLFSLCFHHQIKLQFRVFVFSTLSLLQLYVTEENYTTMLISLTLSL